MRLLKGIVLDNVEHTPLGYLLLLSFLDTSKCLTTFFFSYSFLNVQKFAFIKT